MAKFPTAMESATTVAVPIARVYAMLWDVVGSSSCIPGLARCTRVGPQTYAFAYREVSLAGVSMAVRYTTRYEGDGERVIRFTSVDAPEDNTEVDGELRLESAGDGTRIALRQTLAPNTPVPALLQRMVKSVAEREADRVANRYMQNLKQALERAEPAKRTKGTKA
ncbi:MAG: SRPBCC family protein [Candidatus Binatia bacterium]